MLEMQAHIQDYGWNAVRFKGEVVGMVGLGKRIEAISIDGKNHQLLYRVHVEDIGWTPWKKNGEIAGTVGQAKQIEAIEIKLA